MVRDGRITGCDGICRTCGPYPLGSRLDAFLAEQVIFLGQSVVSASRRQEKILDALPPSQSSRGSEIRNSTALSVGDHIKDLPGVDFAKVGVARSNAVVRGFNNVFSGTLLTLTDNRIARVPSLRVNAFNFIPLTNDDVERIEVVLGPGSALYGPNSADGVMHVITRSPFASQGTSVNVGMGERSLRQTAFRHAGALGDRLGYKVSAQYYTGTEWEYTDPEEVKARKQRRAAIDAEADLPPLAPRDYGSGTRSVETRLDWRATDDLTAILSAGHSMSDVVGLTGVGAVAGDRLAVQLHPAAAAVRRLVLPGLPQLERCGRHVSAAHRHSRRRQVLSQRVPGAAHHPPGSTPALYLRLRRPD